MGMESPRRRPGPGFGGTAPRIVPESPGPRTGRTRVTVSETVTARRSPGVDSDPEAAYNLKFTVYFAPGRPAQLHRCRAHCDSPGRSEHPARSSRSDRPGCPTPGSKSLAESDSLSLRLAWPQPGPDRD
jgi:hypothetical protein